MASMAEKAVLLASGVRRESTCARMSTLRGMSRAALGDVSLERVGGKEERPHFAEHVGLRLSFGLMG